MANELRDCKIAILATDGVEQVELEQPPGRAGRRRADRPAVDRRREIQAMNSDIDPADTFPVDRKVGEASIDDYDALILPGGTCNPGDLPAFCDAIVREFSSVHAS